MFLSDLLLGLFLVAVAGVVVLVVCTLPLFRPVRLRT